LVSHNQKGGCRGSATKKPAKVSKFERTIVFTKGQLVGHFNHTTFVDKTTKLGRHKKENP
jgi:hypothetical protein